MAWRTSISKSTTSKRKQHLTGSQTRADIRTSLWDGSLLLKTSLAAALFAAQAGVLCVNERMSAHGTGAIAAMTGMGCGVETESNDRSSALSTWPRVSSGVLALKALFVCARCNKTELMNPALSWPNQNIYPFRAEVQALIVFPTNSIGHFPDPQKQRAKKSTNLGNSPQFLLNYKCSF